MSTFPRLFEPIVINKLTLKNRVVLPAHGPRLPWKRYLRYLEERRAQADDANGQGKNSFQRR